MNLPLRSILSLILTSILSVSPLHARAQDVSTLTLEQALATATANNPQFQATQAQLAISNAEIVSAGARPNPFLLSDNGVAEKTYRLGLEQTFELGGKRKHRVAVAQAQQEATQANIQTALLELRADVRQAYSTLYNLQERKITLENILLVTQDLVRIAQKREEAGDIASLDVLQTDILRVGTQNDLLSIEADVANARHRLAMLLNQPLDSTVSLAPPKSSPVIGGIPEAPPPVEPGQLQGQVNSFHMNVDELVDYALSHRPEIQRNLSLHAVARRQQNLARANRIPNLSLTAGPDLVTGEEGALGVFVIGILEIPLFNRQQGPIQEAMARQAQAQKEAVALRNQVKMEVVTAYNRFQAHQERIQRYETVLLPMAVAITDKSRRAFQEGKTSILSPIQAQQAYMNSRLGYLQALSDYQSAISDLERAVGAGL